MGALSTVSGWNSVALGALAVAPPVTASRSAIDP
ncbi:hypothetical protein QCE48_26775 [Caballeronia sp. LZ024]|nr:hypothetical protein [Caballeronia sp. LZ024]MDR5840750.1 hypothetical protein [Caballeronia sp. LZ031]